MAYGQNKTSQSIKSKCRRDIPGISIFTWINKGLIIKDLFVVFSKFHIMGSVFVSQTTLLAHSSKLCSTLSFAPPHQLIWTF